jgi:hypothetical protein
MPPLGLVVGFLAGQGVLLTVDLLVLLVGISGVYAAIFMASAAKTVARPAAKRDLQRLSAGHR